MSVYTAERPHYLSADAEARYLYTSKLCRNKRVIDVGTGLGFGAVFLLKNGAKSVLGVDYSSESIKLANNTKLPGLSFRTIEVQHLDKIKSLFDVAVFLEVLEHLPTSDVSNVIYQLAGLVKSGGLLILSTPNGLRSRRVGKELYNPYHVKEYLPTELVQLLKPYFSKVEVKGIDWENSSLKKAQGELKKHFSYRLSVFLGHYRLVRELLGFIPKRLKYLATHEDKLPELSLKDFYLSKDYESCDSLFVVCKK